MGGGGGPTTGVFYLDSSVALTAGAREEIFWTATQDPGSFYDTINGGRFILPEGVYIIQGVMVFSANGTGNREVFAGDGGGGDTPRSIATSWPGSPSASNHALPFTTAFAVPAGGWSIFVVEPQANSFTWSVDVVGSTLASTRMGRTTLIISKIA